MKTAILAAALLLPLLALAGENVPGNCGNGSGNGNACLPGSTQTSNKNHNKNSNANDNANNNHNVANGGAGGQGGQGGQGGAGGVGQGGAGGKSSATGGRSDATGGAGGTSTSSAAGGLGGASSAVGGNNSGNASTSNSFVYERQVQSATAPALAVSNGTCMGSTSAGAQGASFGVSIGSTWNDAGCDRRYNAQMLQNLNQPKAAIALMCMDVQVREAMQIAGTPCALPAVAIQPQNATNAQFDDPFIRHRLYNEPLPAQ